MIKITDKVKVKQGFQKCDKCGITINVTFTRTYPFIIGYKTLCQYCYTSLQTIIERFFNE